MKDDKTEGMSKIEKAITALAEVGDDDVEITPPFCFGGDWFVHCGFATAQGMDLAEAIGECTKRLETDKKVNG